jgi:hypothetical protein
MRGEGQLRFEVDDPASGAFVFDSTSDSGSLEFTQEDAHVSYLARTEDMTFGVSGDNVPFPDMTARLGALGYGGAIPLKPTEAPQDVELNLNLDRLSLSDSLWNIFDPERRIPRDPASLLVDLSGKARALIDLTDPEAFSAPADPEPPVELFALDIDALNLSLGGATLNGSGGFTFDNSDLSTFDGLPAPDGAVTFALTGGMGLLDRLVELGFVAQDQAMGARFMMGLFAVPGDGDSLTSTIEVKPDGSILANGQRLK